MFKIRDNPMFVKGLLHSLGTPRALAVWIAFKHKEWESLASLQWSPSSYVDGPPSFVMTHPVDRVRRDKLASDLFRKVPFIGGPALRKAALESWNASEVSCCATNTLLRSLRFGSLTGPERTLTEFLRKVKNRIAKVLGPLPDFLPGRFSNGTIFEWTKERVAPCVLDKVWGISPNCTTAALPVFRLDYDATLWGRLRCSLGLSYTTVCDGNRWTTVPKTCLTDRNISVEPLGNLWCQLGIGAHLKRRLEKHGLKGFSPKVPEALRLYSHPYDPQPRHSQLAKAASLSGEFATVDLSSASDTIALELVRELIPEDWFALLDSTRSPKTFVKTDGRKGRWIRLEKFSSMGNGFTFELQTLLFCVLAEVACNLRAGESVWVFGDDIIVPSDRATLLKSVFSVLGFTTNPKKTFSTGPFRESCGGEFWRGHDLGSVAFKSDELDGQQIFAYHNALVAVGFDGRLLQPLREAFPVRLRRYGPQSLGDVVFHYGGRPVLSSRDGITLVQGVSFEAVHKIPTSRWGDELLNYLLCGDRVERPYCDVIPVGGWFSLLEPPPLDSIRVSPGPEHRGTHRAEMVR